jgi:hypothetical protein
MNRIVKIIFIAGCIAFFSIPAGICAPARQDSCAALIQNAIKTVNELRDGGIRADVERNFNLDGGLNFRERTRYIFKKCHYIKIDVEFSNNGKRDNSAIDFPSTDIIVRVSKPYLESQIMD